MKLPFVYYLSGSAGSNKERAEMIHYSMNQAEGGAPISEEEIVELLNKSETARFAFCEIAVDCTLDTLTGDITVLGLHQK